MKIEFFSFDSLSNHLLYDLIALRERVFVVEQNCPYLDCDGSDKESIHLLISSNQSLTAYARLVPPHESQQFWSIGRVVVAPEFRGKDIGKLLMQHAIDELINNMGAEIIVISAQTYLMKFYNNLGFHEVGEGYLEDDIPHVKMIYKIEN